MQQSATVSYNNVEEFFNVEKPFLSLADHSLEQSPCYTIIGSKYNGNRIWAIYILKREIKNTRLVVMIL
jgi:hypothetical protein